MVFTWETFLQMLLAVVIGGIIGIEREFRNKSAGFRTIMLICLGATLFTMFSIQIEPTGTGRIASNIVTGIGFLGAGVIFKEGKGVNGITTAATIWVTAALGMGIGAGYEWIAIIGLILLMPILMLFTTIEKWIDQSNHAHEYKIVCAWEEGIIQKFETLFKDYKLKKSKSFFDISEGTFMGNWEVTGARDNHKRFVDFILKEPSIKKFEF